MPSDKQVLHSQLQLFVYSASPPQRQEWLSMSLDAANLLESSLSADAVSNIHHLLLGMYLPDRYPSVRRTPVSSGHANDKFYLNLEWDPQLETLPGSSRPENAPGPKPPSAGGRRRRRTTRSRGLQLPIHHERYDESVTAKYKCTYSIRWNNLKYVASAIFGGAGHRLSGTWRVTAYSDDKRVVSVLCRMYYHLPNDSTAHRWRGAVQAEGGQGIPPHWLHTQSTGNGKSSGDSDDDGAAGKMAKHLKKNLPIQAFV